MNLYAYADIFVYIWKICGSILIYVYTHTYIYIYMGSTWVYIYIYMYMYTYTDDILEYIFMYKHKRNFENNIFGKHRDEIGKVDVQVDS